MGFFNKYPYTNEHELNLDWIIAKINALKDRIKAVEDAIHDIVVVTPNDGKLTIKRNNTIVGDFTANQATDEDINIVVPEKTSDLNNDSGFITSSDIPAQVQSNWNEADNTSPAYIQNKPTIPAAQVNSDWNANSGVAEILNKPALAAVATSGNYNDLSNKPTIPAAQVNSDWNANSGVAQILNKPSTVYSGDWYYYPLGNNWYILFGKKEGLSKNFGIAVGSLYYTTAEDTFTLPFTTDNLFGIEATIKGGGSIFGAWIANYNSTTIKLSYWASQNVNVNHMASHVSCIAHKV